MIYSLRSETSNLSELFVKTKKHLARIETLLGDIFTEMGGFDDIREPEGKNARSEMLLVAKSSCRSFQFVVKVRERITPQIADDLFSRFQNDCPQENVVLLVYAPVISPRVAEIARKYDISYLDSAGNCRIVNHATGLLISRTGHENKDSIPKQPTTDPFSPKSSRIIRAMLHQPKRGWQVSELAKHSDVRVSMGLASKVKRELVRESYAVVRDRLLYLKQPLELLTAWTRNYSGPLSQQQFYMGGDTNEIEKRISRWCEKSNVEYALARFSAGWRLAAEVRYSVASVYVNAKAMLPQAMGRLRSECDIKEVESGANLILLTPFDESVFVRYVSKPERTTSALQTYLDLRSMAGRGSEAADAIFEKYLRKELETSPEKESA